MDIVGVGVAEEAEVVKEAISQKKKKKKRKSSMILS